MRPKTCLTISFSLSYRLSDDHLNYDRSSHYFESVRREEVVYNGPHGRPRYASGADGADFSRGGRMRPYPPRMQPQYCGPGDYRWNTNPPPPTNYRWVCIVRLVVRHVQTKNHRQFQLECLSVIFNKPNYCFSVLLKKTLKPSCCASRLRLVVRVAPFK